MRELIVFAGPGIGQAEEIVFITAHRRLEPAGLEDCLRQNYFPKELFEFFKIYDPKEIHKICNLVVSAVREHVGNKLVECLESEEPVLNVKSIDSALPEFIYTKMFMIIYEEIKKS